MADLSRRLPVELLVAVFNLHLGTLPLFSSERITFLRVVSSVCHYWREAAIGAATLWSDIYNPPHSVPSTAVVSSDGTTHTPSMSLFTVSSSTADRLSTFILRSHRAPLHLHLTFPEPEDYWEHLTKVWTPEAMQRVTHLSYHFDPPSDRHGEDADVDKLISTVFPIGPVPEVQELELDFGSFIQSDEGQLPPSKPLFTPQTAPNLTSIALSGHALHCFKLEGLACPNLCSLQFSRSSATIFDYFDFIRRHRLSLVDIKVSDFHPPPIKKEDHSIEFPRLLHLAVFAPRLPVYVAPALRSLHLTGHPDDADWSVPEGPISTIPDFPRLEELAVGQALTPRLWSLLSDHYPTVTRLISLPVLDADDHRRGVALVVLIHGLLNDALFPAIKSFIIDEGWDDDRYVGPGPDPRHTRYFGRSEIIRICRILGQVPRRGLEVSAPSGWLDPEERAPSVEPGVGVDLSDG